MPAIARVALALALLLPLPATALTLVPGSLLAVKGYSPGDRITQYDASGAVIGTLGIPPFTSYVGLTLIEGDLYVKGNGAQHVWQVDLVSGSTTLAFTPSPATGFENMGRFDDQIIFSDTNPTGAVSFYSTAGVLQSTLSISAPGASSVRGIDGDGLARLFLAGVGGDVSIVSATTGALVGGFATGFNGASGIAWDDATNTVWVSYGFGDGRIRNFSLGGALLGQFPTLDFHTNGLTFVPLPEAGTALLLASGIALAAAGGRYRRATRTGH